MSRPLNDNYGQSYYDDGYQQGRADGYSQAENDYFAQSQKDREDTYNCGYAIGRADAFDEFANALINDGKVSAMRVLKIKEQLKEQN